MLVGVCLRSHLFSVHCAAQAEALLESLLGGDLVVDQVVGTLANDVDFFLSLRDVSGVAFDRLDFDSRRSRVYTSTASFTDCRFFGVTSGAALELKVCLLGGLLVVGLLAPLFTVHSFFFLMQDSVITMIGCEFFNNTGVTGSALLIDNSAAFEGTQRVVCFFPSLLRRFWRVVAVVVVACVCVCVCVCVCWGFLFLDFGPT